MTNREIIEGVNRWQNAGIVHPCTCAGKDGNCGMDLVPEEREEKVVLVCPTCGYVQNWIPEVVINWEDWKGPTWYPKIQFDDD